MERRIICLTITFISVRRGRRENLRKSGVRLRNAGPKKNLENTGGTHHHASNASGVGQSWYLGLSLGGGELS